MKSNIKVAARLRGDITIIKTDVATGRETLYSVRNTITYDGFNSALFGWAQDGVTANDFRITELVVGTNGTPPTHGDVGCYAPVAPATIALAAPNRNVSTSTGELIITATLPKVSPANGSTLREVALMLGNGACFARQVHPDMAKTIAFTLTYIWNIAITA